MFNAMIEALVYVGASLIVSLIELMQSIWEKVKAAGSDALNAFKELFSMAKEGWKNIASELIENIKEKIDDWISAIKEKVDDWKDAGANLIEGLWEGFKGKISEVKENIASFGDDIKDAIKDKLGIASPSKVFAEIGGYMAEGLEVGWDDEIDDVNRQINNDMQYDASVNVSSNIDNLPTETTVKASLLTDDDINRIAEAMTFNFTNITNVDGKTIKEESYQYFIDKATNETRGVAVASGGYY
jgi:gas vesicle protein